MGILVFIGAMLTRVIFKVEIPWYAWVTGGLLYIGDAIRSYANGVFKRLSD